MDRQTSGQIDGQARRRVNSRRMGEWAGEWANDRRTGGLVNRRAFARSDGRVDEQPD